MLLLLLLLLLLLVGLPAPEARLCRGTEHVQGSWEPLPPNVTDASFVCPAVAGPGYENFDYLFHNGSNSYEWSAGCSCPAHRASAWFWKPSQCDLLPWNATQFCELLDKRIVLLVGDSTMHQAAVTLMAMIKDHGGGCEQQVFYGSSHFLIFSGQADFKWHNWILTHKQKVLPDICVLTVGAHQHDEGDIDMIWEHVEKDLVMLRERFFWHNITFAWKTQHPGHAGCYNYSKPLPSQQNNPYRAGFRFAEDVYDWHLHPQFDRMNVNHSLLNGLKIIDMHPLYERPDAHVSSSAGAPPNSTTATKTDCLHNCLPGPVDLFAILFLQMLFHGEL